MAKLSDHGSEIARFFDPRNHALMSVRSDGVTLYRNAFSGWRVFSRMKPEYTLEQWRERKLQHIAELPRWCRDVQCLPSKHDLHEWCCDSICETPTGDRVEPDGHGPDGAPSWLLALGLI